jgi:hypothetical protein
VQDLEDGESTFDDMMLYPYLRAVCPAVSLGKLQFKVGETCLHAMNSKARDSEGDAEEFTLYKADGVISTYDFNKLEVLLLETSGHFGNTDNSKISFDHHKGLFGALSILKGISGAYKHGSMDTFEKVKVFFVHAAGI